MDTKNIFLFPTKQQSRIFAVIRIEKEHLRNVLVFCPADAVFIYCHKDPA